mmetsp:Transcript_76190/g.215587  ORF Transcript_76190/g.215587 Transcript_76190/m.215587 type:complete len:348 (-) Transcript_76190:163-1206(-)
MARPLEEMGAGDRVRIVGGKNFEKFHGGMEGAVVQNNPDSRNASVLFDDAATAGPEPVTVAYRHLEPAPTRGGYSAGAGQPGAQERPEPQGPLLDEHGGLSSRQLVRLHGLQGAAELNGRLGRLRKFDPAAQRWEVDVRGGLGVKRLKEANLERPPKPEVPAGISVAELKERGNECFKASELEQAVAFYGAALELLEEGDPRPPEADDPRFAAVLLGNRAQCHISLCREVHGEDRAIGREARNHAMRANMDAASAIELDPTNGKAYYRRGCAVLGMAPSASRAKEAIQCLETALGGRASGGKDGIVLPNAMRHEVTGLLDYSKRRLDACVEAAVPDVEQCRENCRQQ